MSDIVNSMDEITSPADFTYRQLDWLLEHVNPHNPKDHDIGDIVQSIQRHGFVGAVTVDGESEMLVAGHGRLKGLAAIRRDGGPVPERILVPVNAPDDWFVPTHVKFFKDEYERDAYLIGDNQTTIKGGWDTSALTDMLERHAKRDPEKGLVGTGFDKDDLDLLLADKHFTPPPPAPPPELERRFGILLQVRDRIAENRLADLLAKYGYEDFLRLSEE